MDRSSSLIKTILKIVALVFSLIVLLTAFTNQVVISLGSDYKMGFKAVLFGDATTKGAVVSFVGYILVVVAGLVGVASIFLGEKGKFLSLAGALLAVVGAVLIALVCVFYKNVNGITADNYKLAAGPIVGCVFSGLTALSLAATAFLKDAD